MLTANTQLAFQEFYYLGVSSLSKQHKLFVILDIKADKCLWFIVEEAVCSQCRNHTHDEV